MGERHDKGDGGFLDTVIWVMVIVGVVHAYIAIHNLDRRLTALEVAQKGEQK